MKVKNVRFIIAAITTLSAYSVYVSRVNLSIAIIAMVDINNETASKVFNSTTLNNSNNYNSIISDNLHTINNSISDALFKQNSVENAALVSLSTPQYNVNNSSLLKSSNNNNSTIPAADNDDNAPHGEPMTSVLQAAKKSIRNPLINRMKFDWSQTEQGHILGAFFYGYILFQIPGARLAESVGAKWILLAANVGSAVISLAFPLSTQLNSIHLLMMLRCVMGCCQSAFFPAAYVLFCRWLPEKERAILLPVMFIGSNVGSISTYVISSYLLTSSYGWPSVFYLSGLICSLVTILLCVCASNSPEDNNLITDEERNYILKNTNYNFHNTSIDINNNNNYDDDYETTDNSTSSTVSDVNSTKCVSESRFELVNGNKLVVDKFGDTCCTTTPAGSNNNNSNSECKLQEQQQQQRNHQLTSRTAGEADWSKLLKSVPVWTLILSMYGNEWSTVILCYELPTYLNTALKFPIEQNGVINSFFQLTFAVASPIFSSFGAYLLARNLFGMKKIHVRKLFQSLATFGQLACFMGVPACGANRDMIILLMFAAIIFKACANAGDIMVPGDLSPEFAGTIFAFANSIGNTAGFCAPLLAGLLVKNATRKEEWTPFWLFTATIMCFSGLIFLIFGDTKRQDFHKRKRRQRNHSNIDAIQIIATSRKHSIH